MKITPIQLNKEQIEALANGAMLWFPTEALIIEQNNIYCEYKDGNRKFYYAKELIEKLSPLQIGQEYYVQEEFTQTGINEIKTINEIIKKQWHLYDWLDASKMQEHQSRIKFKVIDIQVERVQYFVDNTYGFLVNIEIIKTISFSRPTYIGKKDINNKKIYADSSIVEFDYLHEEHKAVMTKAWKGYFLFNKEDLFYEIFVFDSNSTIRFTTNRISNIKIIDTVQENKLGLVR